MGDPRCLFGIASADRRACCAIDCGTCEELGCSALPSAREDCCPELIARSSPPCSSAIAPCALNASVLESGAAEAMCEENMYNCEGDVMQFSLHFDRRLELTAPGRRTASSGATSGDRSEAGQL